ncbi:MAG: hypothetical protein KDA58_14350, partial [Planctomycetaceae bacterium]|nr:hypothetical protein [Planctomycetaceae bacterium]
DEEATERFRDSLDPMGHDSAGSDKTASVSDDWCFKQREWFRVFLHGNRSLDQNVLLDDAGNVHVILELDGDVWVYRSRDKEAIALVLEEHFPGLSDPHGPDPQDAANGDVLQPDEE